MRATAVLPVVNGDTREALRDLLRRLLREQLVQAVMVPRRMAQGHVVTASLVVNPAELDTADPLAAVMPVQSARLVARLSSAGGAGRVAVVIRSCEWRALVELVKLKQASLDNLLTIGVDCLGTYEMNDYLQLCADGGDPGMELLSGALHGRDAPRSGHALRTACSMCEHPVAEGADMVVQLVGWDTQQSIGLEAPEPVLSALHLRMAPVNSEREHAVATLTQSRLAMRARLLAEYRARVNDAESFAQEYAACTGCHNCMVACPICYCLECIFRGATFRHSSADYLARVARQGVLRLPADILLFHLTRMNHMATSCVGCGLCTSACPVGLPVATAFRAVAGEVQALFDYLPGRSVEEPLPLSIFREEELTHFGS